MTSRFLPRCPAALPTLVIVHVLVVGLLLPAPLAAQAGNPSDPDATPEDVGATEGRIDGRREGLEAGKNEGRAQVLSQAWLRGFRSGLTRHGTWRRDASWDLGLAEGERPGLALGLESGQARGRVAAADAFLRLLGRPAFMSEAPPAPPMPPPPPGYSACEPPRRVRLQLTHRISHEMDPADCEEHEPPFDRDPRPNFPDTSDLRQRAREDGFQGDAVEAWLRGYKTLFRSEFSSAYRAQREMVSDRLVREWEDEGEIEGRREGERRRACENFATGYVQGWRDGFARGWERGFAESWADEERIHLENPVVRIVSARLVDESGDGVIEPGEGVRAELALANAGMQPSRGEVLDWEGITSLTNRGAVSGTLPAQSRLEERLELGRVPEHALFGAGIEVGLRAANGDSRLLEDRVGRPVVLEGATARLDVADGRLVARVNALIANVATRDADRALSARASGSTTSLGVVQAGERRNVELMVPAPSAWLAEPASGSVELRSGDTTWMLRDWNHAPRFGDSLQVAARLPTGSAGLDEALVSLSRRLMAELERAMNDPRLYNRLDDGSDLAELARVRSTLPAATRADVEARLSRPLMQHAEAKGTPRKVRRAIRQALGKSGD